MGLIRILAQGRDCGWRIFLPVRGKALHRTFPARVHRVPQRGLG
jgi:hypothetical protein